MLRAPRDCGKTVEAGTVDCCGGGGWSGYAGRMRVKLLYFGVLKELAGAADETVEVRDGTTVAELLGILRGRTSNPWRGNTTEKLAGNARSNLTSNMAGNIKNNGIEARLWQSLAVAVNREYAAARVVLREGDEVALLPPVSGGCFADGEKLAALAKTLRGRR